MNKTRRQCLQCRKAAATESKQPTAALKGGEMMIKLLDWCLTGAYKFCTPTSRPELFLL